MQFGQNQDPLFQGTGVPPYLTGRDNRGYIIKEISSPAPELEGALKLPERAPKERTNVGQR
jgi:hypothetical protein